ncbi:MAG TPA: sigma-54 dependent transcriptional regulator [Candidatus Angelobacter sp.]|jgi:DNA-binding NtrC family response regulator|nr:sigma-54 dependent transcriptional regulator [Candidatus Angelobacter sp.]
MRATDKRYRVLVADDQPDVLEALKMSLTAQGFDVETARSPQIVIEALRLREYDTLLLDLNYARDTTSGAEGLKLIEKIQEIDNQVPIIIMTTWGTIDIAVQAVRRGARDFLQKPWNDEELATKLRISADLYRAVRQSQRLEAQNKLFQVQAPSFISNAPAMRPVLELISRVGPSDANVLITGEHGTGKEVVSQTLHALSLRASKPLIAVNTGGLPEGTFESELFGHVKGAFTDARADRIGRFEMADQGTIFLDEIANVPLRQQAKLLRVLESGEMERVGSSRTRQINVRVLSATNADLRAACASGEFREDLLFRLNTVQIRIPPLRERSEDIPALAAHFLRKYNERYGKNIRSFRPDAMEQLMRFPWPGNVRELDHTIERAAIMCRDEQIQLSDLGLQTADLSSTASLDNMSLEEAEQLLISKALARYKGNVKYAAQVLGLSRGTFYRRMEKYGLHAPNRKEEQ